MTNTLATDSVAQLAAMYRASSRSQIFDTPRTTPDTAEVATRLRELGRDDLRDLLAREATLEAHIAALGSRTMNGTSEQMKAAVRKIRVLAGQLDNLRTWLQWVLDLDAPVVGAQATLGDLIHRERSAVGEMTICGARIFRPISQRLGYTERCADCWGAE
jgi:hypothetical protein